MIEPLRKNYIIKKAETHIGEIIKDSEFIFLGELGAFFTVTTESNKLYLLSYFIESNKILFCDRLE